MLIAFVAAAHERDRALRLAQWIEEIGAGKGHDVLLTVTQAAKAAGLDAELEPILSRAFNSYSLMVPFDSVEVPWGHPAWDASSANHLFTRVNRHIQQHFNRPYLYLEMDAVPTRATAFAEIEAVYMTCGKPFMGARVENGRHPVHMSGIAVYPADVISNSKILGGIDWNCYPMADNRKRKMAWDIAGAPEVVPKAHFTDLIQHAYWLNEPCRAVESWDGKAAIFHQCKCGCLINRLRAEKPQIQEPEEIALLPDAEPPPENTVFTYFVPVPHIDQREQWLLIDLWKYSWRKAGWNPVVLNPGFISEEHNGLVSKLDALPSINPPGYDAARYRRWLAMAAYGGWLVDYDCTNNGFEPRPVPKRLTVYETNDPCPSLVAGPASEFLRIAKLFAERGPCLGSTFSGRPHVSDMFILRTIPEEFELVDTVKAYGNDGWKTAKVIHFANETMKEKKPRSEWIPRLLYGGASYNGGDTKPHGWVLITGEPSPETNTVNPAYQAPKRKRTKPTKKKRQLSEEQKQALRDRLANARKAKRLKAEISERVLHGRPPLSKAEKHAILA